MYEVKRNRNLARFLRLGVVTYLLKMGAIKRKDALEVLNGNLTPDDDSTHCDDRKLLNQELNFILKELELTEEDMNSETAEQAEQYLGWPESMQRE